MTKTRDILIPRSPRAGLIYAANNEQHEVLIRHLMLIIGAGRYFDVGAFDPAWQERYNIYIIGAPVSGRVVDERILGFVSANRGWLAKLRVVLLGFCPPGETAEDGLQPLRDMLGSAVLEQIAIDVDPAGLDLPAISTIGLRLKMIKDDGGTKLPASELKDHIESFMKMRKHCVLCTGHGTDVRATTVSYKYHQGHVYIMSEGAGKFANLMLNNRVSIAMFAPRMRNSKVAGIRLQGTVKIWHPDSDEYRYITEIKGSDVERLRSLPFILWALDITVETAEFWWGDLPDQGYAPKQVYNFTM